MLRTNKPISCNIHNGSSKLHVSSALFFFRGLCVLGSSAQHMPNAVKNTWSLMDLNGVRIGHSAFKCSGTPYNVLQRALRNKNVVCFKGAQYSRAYS